MTHLANEYWDLEGDRLVSQRSLLTGGSGVLLEGSIPPLAAWGASRALLVLGLGCAGLLAFLQGSPWPLAVAVPAAVLGLGYSAPPLRLSAHGLGEPATALVVGLLVPAMGQIALAGEPSVELLFAGLPIGLHMAAAMITIELPDREADRATGKDNWVVRLGRPASWRLLRALALAGLASLLLAVLLGGLPSPSLWGASAGLAWLGAEIRLRRERRLDDPRLAAWGLAAVILAAVGTYLGMLLG